MFTNCHHHRRGTRRGVVLILVLGMLGLMAMIGVMFATYSGQAEINARNYSLAQNAPDPANLLDYALAQLINDTDNRASSLRGHSILRDMYGNDATNNGYLAGAKLTGATQVSGGVYDGLYQCVTDIKVSASNSYDFTRWILRFPRITSTSGTPYYVSQTFEVIADDASGTDHVLYVSPPDPSPTIGPYKSPEATNRTLDQQSLLVGLQTNVEFELDGRFLRAFNGPGAGGVGARDFARYSNFRVNGGDLTTNTLASGDPSFIGGMDEDYDACDLENWFLAIQSADGQVVIPSFHRPGILTRGDWTDLTGGSRSKFLRPRAADGHSVVSFPNLVPDPTTGKIKYDVDNDGDGVTDAVWLDLGYPASRNASGQLQKPLFAFTVIGLNGRIPLNTAGNIQRRRDTVGAGGEPIGSPLFSHATHLGNSPSEIDPTYALRNATDLRPTPQYTQVDNAGVDVRLTQLRNLLTGTRPQDNPYAEGANNGDSNFVMVNGQNYYLPNNLADGRDTSANRTSASVAGRWGEEVAVPQTTAPAFNNPIRAGLSQAYDDARDDNYNTFDPWPLPTTGESPSAPSEADYRDAAGGLSLPSERIRRFVTPIDVAGDGLITTWDTASNTGADAWGRVSFLKYFRPPGVPVATAAYPTGVVDRSPAIPDRTNNPYHGYEASRMPKVATLTRMLAAGMPFTGTGGSAPTYDRTINSNINSAALNEADEMQLYASTQVDAPFGPRDLEWLYRKQDVDGASLDSRLAKLAPISFLNPYDGLRRRRMFSVDTWETTNFVWANDNPGGVFATNSRFVQAANASFANLKVPVGPNAFNNKLFNPLFDSNGVALSPANVTPANDPVVGPPALTPSLAHRDRKINLNYPLPVSNEPVEPIRQKWIRDTYQMLKAILPPRAVDTPRELAQLSQFVVNVIDFRDPDGTMTRFVNTDLLVSPASATAVSSLSLRGATPLVALPASAGPGAVASPYSPLYDTTSPYLIQHGMEYNPVAINEVLAYEFDRKGPATTPATAVAKTPRLFVEVVNTLTEAETVGGGAQASDLGLNGWDFVVMADNTLGRPDPITGQIPEQAAANITPVPLGPTASEPLVVPVPSLSTASTGPAATNYYYVFGNPLPSQPDATQPAETNSPSSVVPPATAAAVTTTLGATTPAAPDPNADPNADPGAGTTADDFTARLTVPDKYYWVYLRRPANPFDTAYAADKPNEKRVVVDSFRFIYNKTLGTVDTSGATPTVKRAPLEFLYSLQRRQPYRGGHAVPVLPAATPEAQVTAYGYSEQTVPAPASTVATTPLVGNYGTEPITGDIRHTLGKVNDPKDDVWDYVPFHDRDFTSVAELLMVPGCPPGLFTKVFAEAAPPIAKSTLNVNPPDASVPPGESTDPINPTVTVASPFGPAPPPFNNTTPPHTFPYLVDNFFYTGATEFDLPPPPLPAGATSPPPPHIGGPSGAGWFKMFEFLEVPSPVNGAIGPVAQGRNFDWAREDAKPGLLNLNLVIDEEVFLGLMGDGRLNLAQLPSASVETGQAGPTLVPKVVTMIDTTGSPAQLSGTRLATYPMPNQGFLATNPYTNTVDNRMKAAFSDFLKLRHGGSGYLFAFGTGMVGQAPTAGGAGLIAAERPFHSLSYPDINFTVMRPATLPPSANSNPVETTGPFVTRTPAPLGTTPQPTPTGYTADPGVKNPYLFTANDPVQPPPIPPRRLIQIPDNHGSITGFTPPASNASTTGDTRVNMPTQSVNLTNSNADLTAPPQTTAPIVDNVYLGGTPATTPLADRRQHPYFRTEWLQKVTNLTTVRTHQYAVWITVGFFEVTRQGNPQQAATDPDRLGLEVGAMAGKNVRYRSFFILDRTRAHGFNPAAPGDFRDVVTYRQRIQ